MILAANSNSVTALSKSSSVATHRSKHCVPEAVKRYMRFAGPLFERLHEQVTSPRPSMALRRRYTPVASGLFPLRICNRPSR